MATRATALIVLALIAGGCGFKSEPIGSLPAFPQSAKDALGRQVEVEEAPKGVVSLDPGITEAAFDIGAGKLLVGGTGKETFPTQATKLKPMVKEDGSPNLKAISHSGADLVMVPQSLVKTSADADRLSRRLGMEVYVTDQDSVKGIEHDILEFGLLTGHPSAARALYGQMQQQISQITAPYGGDTPVPVFVDQGYFYTVPDDGLAADLISLAGGRNVAEGSDVSKPFTPPQLQAAAPEVYLALAGSGVTLQGLRRSPGTRTLPAVRDKRFSILPDTVFSRTGPRVVDSLKELVQAIHPGGTAQE